jgi:nucleoside-diphosphate-sugar epimerase
MKNILITGGAGFIGSHLAEWLLRDGENNIIVVDNLINSNSRNIEHLLHFPNFAFLKLDITKPLELEEVKELGKFKIKFYGVQEIYHLACPTSAKNFDKFKIQTLEANALGTRNVCELAVKYKSKVILTSSSVVYGPRPATGRYFKEEDVGAVDHLTPRGCYDEGKRFAETTLTTYEQVHGIDAKIARVFRTYGPRQRLFDGEMMPDFILDALEGRDLKIYGDENFKTTLCFVSDIVEGLIKLMDAPKGSGPVNLGSGEDLKLADVAKKIIDMTGSSSKVVFEKPLMFMTQLGIPDTRKAKELLGWLPLVTLDNGLKQTVDYTRAHKSAL